MTTDQKCGTCRRWTEVDVNITDMDVAIGTCDANVPSSVSVAKRSMMCYTSGTVCQCYVRKVRNYTRKAVEPIDCETKHVSEK